MDIVRPGKGVQVNLVCIDESHIFKHADNALQTNITWSWFFTIAKKHPSEF